ncbi:unnamed protein product [Gadus morhua 'NCC']
MLSLNLTKGPRPLAPEIIITPGNHSPNPTWCHGESPRGCSPHPAAQHVIARQSHSLLGLLGLRQAITCAETHGQRCHGDRLEVVVKREGGGRMGVHMLEVSCAIGHEPGLCVNSTTLLVLQSWMNKGWRGPHSRCSQSGPRCS